MVKLEEFPSMKVLQVITDRDRRGAQVFALDLAAGMKQLGVAVETVALTHGRHGDLLPVDALGPKRRSLQTFRSLRRRARMADVVVAHGSATLLACALGLAGAGVPFVYRQISDPLHWAASVPRRLRVALLVRRADGVVVLSQSVREVFGNHYKLRPDRMTVIPNAVPGAAFRPATPQQRSDARHGFGLDADAAILSYIGALTREKGVDLAILATAAHSSAHLLIVGDGPDRSALESLAARSAASRVTFTGPLSESVGALHASDLLVLPSRGGDSMPAVLIEAGLCGLATVTTPVGAIPDVVDDGVTGSVVPTDDLQALTAAVGQLIDHPERRTAFGRAADARCREMFTIDATAPQWVSLFESVVRRRRRRAA